jgi:hypothetical protein
MVSFGVGIRCINANGLCANIVIISMQDIITILLIIQKSAEEIVYHHFHLSFFIDVFLYGLIFSES